MADQCVQCGSERVVPKAVVWDQGSAGSVMAYVYAKPQAALFKGAPATAYDTLMQVLPLAVNSDSTKIVSGEQVAQPELPVTGF